LALHVVPAFLVGKILKGEFMDMTELLKDNMEVERGLQESEMGPSGLQEGDTRPLKLVALLQLVCCYHTCSQYPEKACKLWAYQATIIGEAKKCGGHGWYLYDAAFQ